MELYENLRAGEKGAWLSIATYLFFSTLKLVVGYFGTSAALKADGLNNTTDIIASVAVLVGLKLAQRPPDLNHQYGHLRAETVASLVASFVMLVVGVQVLSSSVQGLLSPVKETPSSLTAVVALLAAVVMYCVYRYNLTLAKKIKSSAVRATAYDNLSDALVSLGTAIGIVGAIIGYPIIDSITALIVGLIIIKTAIEILWDAVHTLTDGFDVQEIRALKRLIHEVEGVIDVTNVKGRSHGNLHFIDVTITVNPYLTVNEGYKIGENISASVIQFNPHFITSTHIEPHKKT